MEKFEPIGLRSSQFGLIAAVAMLCAWIPILVSIPPILHIVKIDIGHRPLRLGSYTFVVDVSQSSEERANGLPVTLHQLSLMAAKSQDNRVVLKPDPCAPYDRVIKTIAALKIAGPSNLDFADPEYTTSFRKASRLPSDRVFEGVLWSSAALNEDKLLFKSRLATTIFFSEQCRKKAFPNRPADVVG